MNYDLARLKEEQLAKGWSNLELSKRAGVNSSTVDRMFERGSAQPRTVKAVAEAVGIDLRQLVIGNGNVGKRNGKRK